MNYAYINPNDVVNGEGVCVSFWCQGCPHHCEGCFNPETWDFKGGNPLPADIIGIIIKMISANGIQRNFSILGGEPLCDENKELVNNLILKVRTAFPHIKIFLWTGYTLEALKNKADTDAVINSILNNLDVLIDGLYEKEKRNLALKWRGSENQEIHYLKNE